MAVCPLPPNPRASAARYTCPTTEPMMVGNPSSEAASNAIPTYLFIRLMANPPSKTPFKT